MEENLFDKIPGLDKMLETRRFSELSTSEKETVLRHMSREEYASLREVILQSRGVLEQEKEMLRPGDAVRERLLERMEARKQAEKPSVSLIQKLFSFRIPAYQPAFAIALLAVFFFLFHGKNTETVRFLIKTDTVYIAKETAVEKESLPVAKEPSRPAVARPKNTKPAAVRTQQPAGTRAARSVHDQFVESAYQKMELSSMLKKGHTASDDSALMKLLVASN